MTDIAVTDADRISSGRRPPRSSATRRHRVWLGLGAVLVILGCMSADAAVLAGRIDRVAVQFPEGPGDTWVLIGEDSRAVLPPGASVAAFGSEEQVPGSRADVVLVVHTVGERTAVLSVPRDVFLPNADMPGRLALSWRDGPQSMVDALCGLGIAADHLVAVDMAGFAAVVDAVGGVDVDLPAPVRDPAAGLELRSAGLQHLDGATALALVRSRHPEEWTDGGWTPAPVDPDGRAAAAAAVLRALGEEARNALWRPGRLRSLAAAGSEALTVDDGTSTVELLHLLRIDLDAPAVLPVSDPLGGSVTRFADDRTVHALEEAGLSCAVEPDVS
jgi:LCP family protein required for cell wall assembly